VCGRAGVEDHRMYRSNNPVFTGDTFQKPMTWDQFQSSSRSRAASLTDAMTDRMTITGTVTATLVLLAVTAVAAIVGWMWLSPRPGLILPVWLGTVIVGCFSFYAVKASARAAMVTAPVFAIVEGLFCGAVSVYYAQHFGKNPGGPALILTAVLGTFGVAGTMLVAYYFRVIRATPVFTRVVVAACGGLFFVFMTQIVLSLFGVTIPYIWGTGPIGIGVCLLVIGLSAAVLVLDFNYIEQGVERGYPKVYEWVGAFGLLVTLVTLYVWILKLLAALRRD
jgi:uncharacterized YccA/Bax inhibitor family protein